ncbi:hypothetical protein Nepgr_033631 [Nepenthes gracilis]|uniref:Uncharacterized protein n=1 Tax=Nepenthes gracilis TaxID=150966 RepID=A0AAD3TMU7_NEPGR|nr:hypothetical protein Nepgr_033631 [Nepenthes gracilis]
MKQLADRISFAECGCCLESCWACIGSSVSVGGLAGFAEDEPPAQFLEFLPIGCELLLVMGRWKSCRRLLPPVSTGMHNLYLDCAVVHEFSLLECGSFCCGLDDMDYAPVLMWIHDGLQCRLRCIGR